MPTSSNSPVLARKRLAQALRALREERGLTLDQVSRELMISDSKLSRLEKAQGLPQLRDVRDLVRLYDLAGLPDGERLMRWARDGRRKGWWVDYGDVIRPEEHEFIAYENEAKTCLAYAIPVMHGLLQTPRYTRSLLSNLGETRSEHEIDRIVETRAIRQENLTGRADGEALELRVVLHESCLSQSVGSPQALHEQLESLLVSAKQPNIQILILPLSSSLHVAATSSWQHFSFGEDVDRDVAITEASWGFRYLEDETMVRKHERWFGELERRSMDPNASLERIRRAIEDRS